MIILDSNVVSALMRFEKEAKVMQWVSGSPTTDLFVTVVTVFEITFGLQRMPVGTGRRNYEGRFANILTTLFPSRVLSFDEASAAAAAAAHIKRGRHKADLEAPESMIAGIALHYGATIATRNAKDFRSLPIPLVDPWTA
jgi:toxin FitB